MDRLNKAQAYVASGLSMIPIGERSKSSPIQWKAFQKRMPTDDELRKWVECYPGLGVVCGVVSANLEVLDIEAAAPLQEFHQLVENRLTGFLARIPRVKTPTNGRHLFYRCETIAGNQKLASDGNGKTLIETRGEGGQVLSPLCLPGTHPNGGVYEIVNGDLTHIPKITPEEREILFSSARSFNEHVEQKKAKGIREAAQGNGMRPGESFNNSSDVLAQVQSLLRDHGWSKFGNGRAGELWSRPGVTDHSSATLYDSGSLYVFSSNALPFCAGEAYSPFAVYAELKHSGDFSAAAKGLAGLGFGQSNGHKSQAAYDPKPTELPPNARFKLTTLDDLLAEPEDDTQYLVDKTLPCNGTSLFCAKPKVMKTTTALDLGVKVTLGLPFLGRPTKKGKVVYFALEEKRSEIKRRLSLMGAHGEDFLVYTGAMPPDAFGFVESVMAKYSPALLMAHPTPRLIKVCDVLCDVTLS